MAPIRCPFSLGRERRRRDVDWTLRSLTSSVCRRSKVLVGNENRVQSRLLRVFLLQLALISVVTWFGVLAASWVAERILVKQALSQEADYFWQQRELDAKFSVPNSLNLQGFLDGDTNRGIPPALAELSIGQHRVNYRGDDVIAYVSEKNSERLILLFQDETVANLGFYFGVVPLSLVLLFVYGLAFMAYVLARRAVSPITRLSEIIENFDFDGRDAAELDLGNFSGPHNSETLVLVDALQHFIERTNESLERERNFARYSSHELRTPVAIIQGSVSTLELLDLDGAPKRAVNRIGRASKHMGDLITTLLHLASNKIAPDENLTTSVNLLTDDLVTEINEVLSKEEVQINVHHLSQLAVAASEATLRIVIGNILRNAHMYTSLGHVSVTISGESIAIEDTGPGLSKEEQRRIFEPFYRRTENTGRGMGLGLALVKATCDNFGWNLDLASEPGNGNRV